MNLKCVYCGEEAEFVIGGKSLCLKHLPPRLKMKMTSLINNKPKKKAVKKSALDASNVSRVPVIKPQ